MNASIFVPEWALFSAFRYALGRRSYIVGETVELIRSCSSNLSRETIDLIVRDIDEFLRDPYEREERYVYQPWAELRDELRREMEWRQA